jgi:organic hydroperoxide reductase OsmC/OhrA
MKISARVENSFNNHQATVNTNGQERSIQIPAKATGFGSSANGGELLFLALATCYCNDIYREAERQGIQVLSVEVEVNGDFGGVGEPASNVSYRAKVMARADQEAIRVLMMHTDLVAEIQNTLRSITPVTLVQAEAISIS